jgi:hypothetical protein
LIFRSAGDGEHAKSVDLRYLCPLSEKEARMIIKGRSSQRSMSSPSPVFVMCDGNNGITWIGIRVVLSTSSLHLQHMTVTARDNQMPTDFEEVHQGMFSNIFHVSLAFRATSSLLLKKILRMVQKKGWDGKQLFVMMI